MRAACLQDRPAGRFARNPWTRPGLEGGGTIGLMHGRVFEKVGVNVSVGVGGVQPGVPRLHPRRGGGSAVLGCRPASSRGAHPQSPHVPAAHMNTRMIVTTRGWFGGGGDITPMWPDSAAAQEDAASFHAAFQAACDAHHPAYYPEFKAWCDRYFYLPHRNEPRGLGGIFYDHLERQGAEQDFAFTRDVGLAFLDVYPAIVRRRMDQSPGPRPSGTTSSSGAGATWSSTCCTTVARCSG